MNPAETVIDRFGGIRPLARLIDIEPSSVYAWKRSGLIPSHRIQELLDLAKAEGVQISLEELVIGS